MLGKQGVGFHGHVNFMLFVSFLLCWVVNAVAKLASLDQRRIIQLLSLMFNHKARHNARRPVARQTRNAERYTFYKECYNNVKYKNSPYYKGSETWDTLPRATIDCDNIYVFKKLVKKMYSTFKV